MIEENFRSQLGEICSHHAETIAADARAALMHEARTNPLARVGDELLDRDHEPSSFVVVGPIVSRLTPGIKTPKPRKFGRFPYRLHVRYWRSQPIESSNVSLILTASGNCSQKTMTSAFASGSIFTSRKKFLFLPLVNVSLPPTKLKPDPGEGTLTVNCSRLVTAVTCPVCVCAATSNLQRASPNSTALQLTENVLMIVCASACVMPRTSVVYLPSLSRLIAPSEPILAIQ